MTLTIELPQELEDELAAEAQKLGLPLTEYALRLLLSRPGMDKMPGTGAELVAYWHEADLIGARPDIENSRDYARRLRREAETRTQS